MEVRTSPNSKKREGNGPSRNECLMRREFQVHTAMDAAAALEAGNDIRTGLVCFALDSSHGYERTHQKSILSVSRLLALYMQTDTLFERDKYAIGPLRDFPDDQSDWEDTEVENAGQDHNP